MKKKIFNFILYSLLGALSFSALQVYATTQGGLVPWQGGTGIVGVTAGEVGTCLKVLANSPFRFELGTCGSGSGVWPFTTTANNFNLATQSTSTPLWLRGSPFSLFASSTAVFVNASTTLLTISDTASTTNLTVSALNAASCDVKSTNGVLSCGTDATGTGTFEWTPTTNFGVNANSTTTAIWMRGSPYSLFASSTAVFVNASTTQLTLGSDFITDLSTGLTISATGVVTAEVITAGDALTRTGDDIDFDGGTVPSGDLGGTWASPSVTDDSHAHTSGTISGLDVSADTNLAVTWPVILSNDTLSFGGLSTSSAAVVGNIPYFSGVNTFANVATTSITCTGLLSCTGFNALGSASSLNLAAASANTVLVNQTSGSAVPTFLATSTFGTGLYGAGTAGQVLMWSGSAPVWASTSTCVAITGSSDLCDGSDATGAGGSGTVSTSTNETAGRLPYWTTTSGTPAKLGEVATTSLTASGVITLSQPISVIGTSASALTVTGGTNGQVLGWSGGLPTWLATTTLANISGTLGIGSGGTNATSFTTSGNGVYYTGSALATAPLTSAVTYPYASTTMITATTASTTNLTVSALNSASCDVKADTNGVFSCGTDATGSGVFEWTPTTNFNQNANSTTTQIWLRGSPFSLTASSTAIFNTSSTTLATFGSGSASAPSISFNNDGDTGFFSDSANNIEMTVGGTQIVTISSSDFTLGNGADYFGDKYYTNTIGAASSPQFSMNIDSVTGMFLPSGGIVGFSTSGTERGRFHSTGFFGLGTTTPSNRLSVQGPGYISSNLFVGGTITSTSSSYSTFPYASTTMVTATTASTTNLTVSALNSANCDVKANTNGVFSCGTDSEGSGTYPFTPLTNFGMLASATTSPLWLQGTPFSLFASSTAVFVNASTTQLTIGSDYITDLSTGLAISATGVVTVDDVTCTNCLTATEVASADLATNVSDADFGDVTVASGAWAVEDDSHAHTSTSLSGIDISADTNLTAGTNITLTDDDLSVDDAFILNTGDVGTGSYTFPYASSTALTVSGSAYFATLVGSVGIGTTSPYAKLSVHANHGETNKTLFSIGSSTASATTSLFTVLNSGNIGIGTNAPQAPLHVSDGAVASSSLLSSDKMLFSYNQSAGFAGLVSSNAASTRPVFKGTRSRGTLEVPTAVQNNDDVFTVLSAAFDGITTQATAGVFFKADGAASSGVAPQRISFVTSETTAALRTERLTIKSSGSIGIGTTTPGAKLAIDQASSTLIGMYLAGYANATADMFRISTSTLTATSTALVITSKGRLGIGTTTPAGSLGVNGDIFLDNILVQSGTGNVLCLSSGQVVQDDSPITACSGASSRLVKQNISTLSSNLQDILAMRPVSYQYKESYKPNDRTTHLGFIAEEIKLIDPVLIEYDGNLPGLKYTEFIPKIIGAIQEMWKKIVSIEGRTKRLDKENKELRSRLEALENKLK